MCLDPHLYLYLYQYQYQYQYQYHASTSSLQHIQQYKTAPHVTLYSTTTHYRQPSISSGCLHVAPR